MMMRLCIVIIAMTCICVVRGFVNGRCARLSRAGVHKLSARKKKVDNVDGDVTDDITVPVDVVVSEEMKSQTPSEKLGITGSGELTKAELNAAILSLEKVNPTMDPANSPLLNGVWDVYSTGLGSPGLVAYQLLKSLPSPLSDVAKFGDLCVTITRTQPRVCAECTLSLGTLDVSFKSTAELEGVTGSIIKESFTSLEVNDKELPKPAESITDKLSRELVITYLDDDVLIVRDSLGAPEILRRQDYMGIAAEETAGGSEDAPGASS